MQYPALDDPERSVSYKWTKRPIEFYYSINWQHLVLIQSIRSLITDALLGFQTIFTCVMQVLMKRE